MEFGPQLRDFRSDLKGLRPYYRVFTRISRFSMISGIFGWISGIAEIAGISSWISGILGRISGYLYTEFQK